jgi:hypothetical protein
MLSFSQNLNMSPSLGIDKLTLRRSKIIGHRLGNAAFIEKLEYKLARPLKAVPRMQRPEAVKS